jgi:hypothetical protein
MFDFGKIGMIPLDDDFKQAPTEEQIAELEKYWGHALPENYKFILNHFNGGSPEANYFEVIDPCAGIAGEWNIGKFFTLDGNKEFPSNIWWKLKNYAELMGDNALPFADDGIQQIYYLKWINNSPQVWYLAYLDLDEPETFFLMNSFDELLGALQSTD